MPSSVVETNLSVDNGAACSFYVNPNQEISINTLNGLKQYTVFRGQLIYIIN